MIPIKLQLENFMSYGKGVPPLQLSDVRLACLSGDNGNGKSALLDAMTWALFGATRAPREDDVIRIGAPLCRVLFDFQLADAKYRIIKQRDRKGSSPVWTLQVWQEDGTLRNISDGRETKLQIERLLRLNYEMFLATAYLAQGQADVFARAKASERKQIVADILDLSRYDDLEKRARDRHREARESRLSAEQQLLQIDHELQDEDRVVVELEAAEAFLADTAAQQARLQAERDSARAIFDQCQTFADQARDREEKLREWEADIVEAERECVRLRQLLENAGTLVARLPELEQQEQEAERLQQRIQQLETQVDAATALYREHELLTDTVNRARAALEREVDRLSHEIETYRQESKELERYESEKATTTAEIAAYGDTEAQRLTAEEARANLDERLADLRAQHGTTRAEQDRLERRLAALTQSDAAECEFCGQALTPTARHAAIEATEETIASVISKLQALSQEGKDLKRHADEARFTVEQIHAAARQVTNLVNRLAHAEQESLRLGGRVALLPDRERRYHELSQQLREGAYAQVERERLVVISAQREKAERLTETLRDLRRQAEPYRQLPRERERITTAQGQLESEPARLQACEERIREREIRLSRGRPLVEEAKMRATNLPQLRQNLENAEYALRRQTEDTHRAHSQMGRLKAERERLALRAQERGRVEEERTAAARSELLYAELTAAFGKKGVQALIIENALPEIQEEANRLLGRMTSGAMSIAFETHREARTKNAGPIETLDIIISDDLGTRSYEMYSGGEAFRVNLALRVALSKMLARRAGAPLQTLILDEGFGTQDPRGREAIAEALEAISEEFALILVITHIEELKDRFPTRIEVVKGPQGSTFTLD